MGIFKKVSDLFSPIFEDDKHAYWVYVQCNRCGEKLRARVDMRNELSIEYGDKGTTYHSRKVLIGEQRCFQQIELKLTFSSKRKLIDKEITGGEFISKEAYIGDVD